jgi:hypothetical protein
MSIGLVLSPAVTSAADDATRRNIEEICKTNPKASVCDTLKDPNPETGMSKTFQSIINILLFIGGTIAIIVIITSGIRMSAARGNTESVTKARQTIIYACVGLAIAVSAFALVNFVIVRLTADDSGGGATIVTPQNCTDQGKAYVAPDDTTDPPTPAHCV